MNKAIEHEGEFNEQDEEEESQTLENNITKQSIIDIEQIKNFEDFKLVLVQLDEQRILTLRQQSEESMRKYWMILEFIKKEKQQDEIQYIQKIFSMVPQYHAKLQQISNLKASIRGQLDKIKRKKKID
ncbi:unnamed protein product (macronuclear) [Paramecium tetraurelia]|uniref:Uncharacterized protein n=1 Tax=Paramecium tetraurelia TaxID=5888 RepID=A0BNV1_PARTE|nr:uncharacterized protein GSPATT00030857001 [Paramecium tetraurelia]CAK60218.1 unnamed protein product [Paramecium tetraurelia]|eukprot:XP_001427616.1 hypothetical protein (macronuclear) [Paramecium tetraurelia strain d4-2]